MTDPLDVIEEACCFGLRMALRPSSRITGCLKLENGFYVFIEPGTVYHPLEAVLHGIDIKTGDWRADAATLLEVDAAWIEGFIHGFAQASEQSNDQEYVQGYLVGEIIRDRRKRMLQE